MSCLFIAAVGQNVDDGEFSHTFGLDGHFNVQSILVGIKVGMGFDRPVSYAFGGVEWSPSKLSSHRIS